MKKIHAMWAWIFHRLKRKKSKKKLAVISPYEEGEITTSKIQVFGPVTPAPPPRLTGPSPKGRSAALPLGLKYNAALFMGDMRSHLRLAPHGLD